MRVLLAGQTYGPRNGPGVFTRNLARGLVVSGHEVTVAVPAGQLRSSERNDAGVRVCEVRGVTLAPLYPDVMVSLGSIRAAERILRERRPDLVHVQDHYPLSRAFVRAASIPIVATNHFVPENITAQTWFGRVGPLRRAFDRFSWKLVKDVLNAAAIVTSPTATAAAILTRHGVSPQVRVISCGVDTKRFTPRPEHHDGIVAIYVGRLDRDKDVQTLVEAIWRCDGVRLVIAGRGRQERHLRKSDRVIFKGFVADEELPQLLLSADFFAIAGRAELQSIATLEAMACGLPVVAADALALPELVTPGVNGELFRPGDPSDAARAIARLIDRKECWAAMSRASREIAERHDLSNTVRAYEKLYAEVL